MTFILFKIQLLLHEYIFRNQTVGSFTIQTTQFKYLTKNQLTLKCTTPTLLVLNAAPDVTTP